MTAHGRRMIWVHTPEAARELDRLAQSEFGLASIVLMEHAAMAVAHAVEAAARRARVGGVVAVCGTGNNGGDGLAAARLLVNGGLRAAAALPAGEPGTADARTSMKAVLAMGLPVFRGEGAIRGAMGEVGGGCVVIDALVGTGLSRDVSGGLLEAIREIKRLGSAGAPVVAVDCPSGLDAGAGVPRPEAVVATRTVTFGAVKSGFLKPSAWPFLGEVVVGDLGVPGELVERLGVREEAPAGLVVGD